MEGMYKPLLAAAAILAIAPLAACGSSSSSAPTVTVTATTQPSTPNPTELVPASSDPSDVATEAGDPSASGSTDDGSVYPFGTAVPGENVSITVDKPTLTHLSSDETCSPAPKAAYKVVIRVTNISKKPWDAGSNVIIDATSGSAKPCDMSALEDGENNAIMPTRTGTITKVFGVTDPSAPLTVSIGGLGDVYWTNDPAALKAAGK